MKTPRRRWAAASVALALAARGEPLIRYTFDEATSGAAPAADLGAAPAATGTFFGAAARTADAPARASAAALNVFGVTGASHYVSAGDANKLDGLSNLTLTAWINLRAAPAASDRVLSKLYSDGTNGTGFDLRLASVTSASNFALAFVEVNNRAIAGLPSAPSSNGLNAADRWLFVAVTYDGASVRFWRGGTNEAVAPHGPAAAKPAGFGTPADTTADFRIGSTPAVTSDRTPPAWFDDVRVYGSVLSTGELEVVRLENVTGPTSAVPALLRAEASPTRRAIRLAFSRPVADSATNAANFSVDGGLTLVGAEVDPDTLRDVTVRTGAQAPNAEYTLVVTGIFDRASGAGPMPPATNRFASPPLYGPGNNVPASAGWDLLYALNIASSAAYHTAGVPYGIDHSAWASGRVRVAYYLELQESNGPLRHVWAAMDAFTSDPTRLGVPRPGAGSAFDQPVANLNVHSDVPGVTNGTGLAGGVIRFRPGDDGNPEGAGPGAMRISCDGQVLLAFHGWGAGGAPDLGLGDRPGVPGGDWTGASNAAQYAVKRLLVFVRPPPPAGPEEADIVVYGGTSGGVAAAVKAARMGKRAVLVATDNHLGGLSSGGLGWTDVGNLGTGYIGGLAREFYERNGARYGQAIRFNLEPHVAEDLFGEMLAEAGVRVFFNRRLAAVTMDGARIAQAAMEDGSAFRGGMFVDATYEGDLAAAAGVSFTVGREASAQYGESLAGIRALSGSYDYDPYVVPGNPGSGLLSLVEPDAGGAVGDADGGVQAYNFRMCFTQSPTNALPLTAPAGYDESAYELVARYLEARVAKDGSVTLGQLMTLARSPAAGKYDINNNGELSTDLANASRTWPTNTHAGRDALYRAHEAYQRGFFTFLATSLRAPASLRTEMASWGMCQDEFMDTGGWPHALYVREARRMVSDYVMTQGNCSGSRAAPDGIGLGAYPMDSHIVRRVASGGLSRHEGGMFTSLPGWYPISYRALIPRTGECANVFCTFALSASHAAFGSCRMEPVFMITSESAATAAAMALDDDVAVQALDYGRLVLQLRADGQLLSPSGDTGASGLIVDNNTPGGVAVAGAWTSSSASPGFWGADYLHDGNTGKGDKSVTFTPTLPIGGAYQVFARWAENANRATNVPIDIVHAAGTTTVYVNQQADGGTWFPLVMTNFNAGTNARVVVRTDGTTGYVIADAVRFLSSNLPPASVEVVATDARGSEAGDAARVTFVRAGDTGAALVVQYQVGGTAGNGTDVALLPGTITLAPGAVGTSLWITGVADSLVEGAETVVVTVQPGTGYDAGSYAAATVTVADATAPAPPEVAGIAVTGGMPRVRIRAAPGQSCEVQRAPEAAGPWTAKTNLILDAGGAADWPDPAAPPGRAFYRVRLP